MTAVSPVGSPTPVAPLAPFPDAAFADLYRRHSDRVLGYCLKHLRSREEAEDAAQTTFFYAWRGLGRGVVPEVESAWLFTIARNVCINRSESAGRRSVEFAQDPSLLEDTVPAPARSDELDGLPEALASLTEQQRRAILMREWQGLTYREIAQELGLSQAAVETLLFRARRALAARLRRPLGVGSLLPWCKSMLAGGGAKLSIGVAFVAVSTTAGVVATAGHDSPAVPAKTPAVSAPSAGTPAAYVAPSPARAPAHARPAAARSTRTRARTPRSAPGSPPPAAAPQATPAQPTAATPAAPGAAPPATPSAGKRRPGPAPEVTSTVASAVAPVSGALDSATGTVAGVVGSATGAVGDSAQAVVGTVTSAAGAVAPPQQPPAPAPPAVTVPVPSLPVPKLPIP